ncbi:MAG: tetratricopeptide repeat-containing protein [Rhizomicrobium sp.]
MPNTSSLLSIIAHARAGALDHACRLFLEGGFELVNDDPSVLSVRGRLLKDRALAAEGAERRRLYLEAAGAYARAAELGGATYPLVNAATLFLLAGRGEQSKALAGKLLERARTGGDELETPYYRAATEAEALLLLGNAAQARTALRKAVALAPRAFEDHASTLRQFELILREFGKDDAWLDSFRPPRALHFAGGMGVSPDSEAVRRRVRAHIAKERIGYGYGALAAGADILIAQALLEEGAELHLVLPMPRERFREHSVAAFGSSWTTKFDRILARAASVRAIADAPDPVFPLAIQLAAEIAMGSAVMQAQSLMTQAVQLLILDKPAGRGGGVTAWIAAQWKKSGRRQLTVAASRAKGRAAETARAAAGPIRLAAMLRIDLSEAGADRLSKELLPRLARALGKPRPLFAPRWTGEALLVAYQATAAAAAAAHAAAASLADAGGVRIAGHYASVRQADDVFSGKPFLAGPATRLLERMVRSVPPGAIHLSEDFAAALHAGAGHPHTEYVGDLDAEGSDEPVRLFALKS